MDRFRVALRVYDSQLAYSLILEINLCVFSPCVLYSSLFLKKGTRESLEETLRIRCCFIVTSYLLFGIALASMKLVVFLYTL